MSEVAVSDPQVESEELETVRLELGADQAIAACGGDMRSAVRALILANEYLEYEIETMLASVSKGYMRGHLRRLREAAGEG